MMKRNPSDKISASNTSLKLLDVVALLKAMPKEKLVKGQVGTIVEVLDEGVYEVEFADKQGRTIKTLALSAKDLMQLHFEIEAA
jgi:hypothetical protein